jgi:tRNA (adenine57-N1/adenine58-N1)-methyltransferase
MDFARPLTREASAVSKSNIRYVPVLVSNEDDGAEGSPSGGAGEAALSSTCAGRRESGQDDRSQEDGELDRQLIQAANRAAAGLFGVEDESRVDSSQFPDRLLPSPDARIRAGDLVVLQLAFDQLDFVYVTPGQVYHNRNGKFPHDRFVGMPFGSKVRSADKRGYGFLFLLKPTPELWVRSLNHRTQIIHELDSSQIVFQLHLRPNAVAVETGTGSAGLSHAIARTIAPRGRLHTYEFNGVRADTARAELERNGLEHLVTVHHGDSCAEGFPNLPARSVDAAMLDLPEPWRAVPHCARALKLQGRIASYSPCIEQAQRTVQALEEWGFHSVVTMEYRLREHYVDQVELEPPPAAKRPRIPRDKRIEAAASGAPGEGEDGGVGDDAGGKADADASEDEGRAALGIAPDSQDGPPQEDAGTDRRRLVVARPFTTMRGHTAFLTFATLGIRKSEAATRKPSGDGAR